VKNFQQGYFQNTRPVRRGPPKVARAAADVFSRLAKTTRYADPGLADNWPSIAGADIAALGRPGRLLGNGPGRTLEIIAPDGAAAAELQMRTGDLLTAINRYLGPGAVNHIAVKQRPGEAARTGGRDDDANEPLGAALSSFRAAIRARSSDK